MQKKYFFGNLIAVLTIAFLTGCGGGGSSSSAPGSTAINSSSSSSILSSSSSILSSSSSILPSSSSSSSSSKKLDPIITEKTSYLNKIKSGNPNHGMAYTMIGADGPSKGMNHLVVAYGDFFQDGTIATFAQWFPDNSTLPVADQKPGVVKFFHRTADGKSWEDRTSELLKDGTGCISLRKANIADFNEDGKPDLYLGCHGADVAGSLGENQRILLSQPDGTYTNNVVPLICYCHASTAGDLNGDGHVDVLTYDTLSEWDSPGHRMQVLALMGNGDGTFTNNPEYAPKLLDGKNIYTLELIDTGRGMLELFVGGAPTLPGREPNQYAFNNSILYNDGDGKFTSTPVALDNTPGQIFYELALDFVVRDGYVYMSQIADGYKSNAVRKVDLRDPTQSTLIFEHVSDKPSAWIQWVTFVEQDKVAIMCFNTGMTYDWCDWEEN